MTDVKSPSMIPCRFCNKPYIPCGFLKEKRGGCMNFTGKCPIAGVVMTLTQWEAGVVEGKTNDRCNIIHPEKLLNPNQRVLVIPLEET